MFVGVDGNMSPNESEIPMGEDSISSLPNNQAYNVLVGMSASKNTDNDTFTCFSSTTSGSDAMLDAQVELANARLAQATAQAELAALKVAKAAKKAPSGTSSKSYVPRSDRSRSRYDVLPNDVASDDAEQWKALSRLMEQPLSPITPLCHTARADGTGHRSDAVAQSGEQFARDQLSENLLHRFNSEYEEQVKLTNAHLFEEHANAIKLAEYNVLQLQSALRAEAGEHMANASNVARLAEHQVALTRLEAEQYAEQVNQAAQQMNDAARAELLRESVERQECAERARIAAEMARHEAAMANQRQAATEDRARRA